MTITFRKMLYIPGMAFNSRFGQIRRSVAKC